MKPPEVSAAIDAPQRTVWAALTRLSDRARVLDDVRSVEFHTDDSFQVGAQWRERRRATGRGKTETLTVIAVHQPVAYSVRAERHGLELTRTTELVALSPWRTQVTTRLMLQPSRSQGRFRRILVRVFGIVEAKRLVKSARIDLDDLARHLGGDEHER